MTTNYHVTPKTQMFDLIMLVISLVSLHMNFNIQIKSDIKIKQEIFINFSILTQNNDFIKIQQ